MHEDTEERGPDPFMSIDFRQDPDGEIKVSTTFSSDVPVEQFYGLVGQAIQGMLLTAEKIGQAKGLTTEEIHAAVFGEK